MTTLRPAPVPDEVFVDLPARLRRAAADRPGDTALIDGARGLDAAALARLMDQCASRLITLGLRPGDVLATVAGTTADHVVLYLGALAAGAAVAPLPGSAHPDALARMLDNAAPRLTFADADAPALPGQVHPVDGLIGALADTAPAPPRAVAPEALFDVIYSSGTTGAPKGIEHDALFRDRQVRRMASYGLGPGTVTLISTPVCSNTTLAALWPSLGLGGAVVLMRRFDTEGWLALAQRHRVTHTMLVPVQYRRLLDDPGFDAADLSAFVCKLSTSAPLPAPLSAEILARWPGRMINIYGMTEGGVSAVLDCGARPDKLHSVGRAVTGAEIRVIDARGRPLPAGEVGEVVGRSTTVMRGYRGAPQATRDATWTDADGHDFVRTGDMGRLDAEGFLTLLDRRRDMIVSGGFNIFAADLEEVLHGHPDVAEAAVVAAPSARWGETPLAFVARRPGAATGADALRDWANERLGRTQRLSGVRLLQALPRNAIGKVLKRELRDRAADAPGETV